MFLPPALWDGDSPVTRQSSHFVLSCHRASQAARRWTGAISGLFSAPFWLTEQGHCSVGHAGHWPHKAVRCCFLAFQNISISLSSSLYIFISLSLLYKTNRQKSAGDAADRGMPWSKTLSAASHTSCLKWAMGLVGRQTPRKTMDLLVIDQISSLRHLLRQYRELIILKGIKKHFYNSILKFVAFFMSVFAWVYVR